jgi:galactose mutarotase-like enzyme
MTDSSFVTLNGPDGSIAYIAPHLGGWLLRYARPIENRGLVEALYCKQEIIDRYPKEMYAGSPILFPLVSFNRADGKDHHYEWEGQVYQMPQHGFGRRSKWNVVEQTPVSVTIELPDTEDTRANYPFSFRQRLTYRLEKGRLHWEQVIENRSERAMPFASGFHPYFSVPLGAESSRNTCFVEVPEAKRMIMQNQAESFVAESFPAQNWNVSEDVSATLFLSDLKKKELALVDPVSRLEVFLNFEEAPQYRFIALWAKTPNEPYFCIEPWTSLPNPYGRPQDKELVVLQPKSTFRAAMWMELRTMR